MSKDLKIGWAEHKIEDVMGYFIKGLRPHEGVIVNSEWCYDPRNGKVIFKLWVGDSKIVALKE